MTPFLSLGFLLAGASLAGALHIPIPRHSRIAARQNAVAADSLVAASWYAGWHAEDLPIANISWSKYTHMTYSFAETSGDGSMITVADSDAELLPQFVQAAHANNVKALVSLGGWTGARFFSSNVADATNRTAFVNAITSLAIKYSLDGIDFDWEYPNSEGIGCNVQSPADVDNFLSLLQALRADPTGSKLILTAAVAGSPWPDANNNPSTNLTGFASTLDYIAIMNYDVFGPFSATAGPN
ncbi:hypothetical protein EWM64_g5618, partial [Hericium alpestre]